MTDRQGRIAVDIGGTFTDVALQIGGRLTTTKTLTTHAAPQEGVLAGIDAVLAASGARRSEVGLVVHGTTLATNAIIERQGARVALIVTEGHRDALEMAYENRFEQYDIGVDRPDPLVPRRLRLPVRERVDYAGRVLLPLDEDSVRALIPTLEEHSVESVAVGLIHGYAYPRHEQRVGEIIGRALPRIPVTLASDACPEIREYERQSTTVANAYVRPLMSAYLQDLADALRRSGLACPFLLMTSGGGLTTLESAVRAPIRLVESGPAGGAILASRLAQDLKLGEVLSFDMGGTTAKLCLIGRDGPLRSRAFEVARSYLFKPGSGLPVRVPVIEMVEIGAGGGSIASVDELGRVAVGPRSSGSEPGPAAYGLGGEHATVTDSDLVLGRIDARRFAGGSIPISEELARGALKKMGEGADMDAEKAAAAVSEVVEENMATAARHHAVESGKGLSERVVVAFGGSAPLHAARLAEKLGQSRVLVPSGAGVGSAVGFLRAPISYEVARSRYARLDRLDPAEMDAVFREMRAEAMDVVGKGAPGVPARERAMAYMRYVGQGHELAVPVPAVLLEKSDAPVAAEEARALLKGAFEKAYLAVFGRVIERLEVEVLSWTLARSAHPPESLRAPTPWAAETSDRKEPQLSDRLIRDELASGQVVAGPALIDEAQTTTVVPDGWRAEVLEGSHLLLSRDAERRREGRLRPASDPLSWQLLWDRLLSVVEEQARTLVRTAFSTPVREAGDLSAGVFDPEGRMLAQAVTGTPGHVNAMAASVGHFLASYPLRGMVEGDVFITNDPWKGTGHLNDFTVVTPTFLDGEPVALFAATSHIADVGGRGFGADANQVYEEGIRIPITPLIRAGRVDETLMRLLRANVREPDVAEGDLYSLAACNRTGSSRLLEIMREFGLRDLGRLADHILNASRAGMLKQIGRLRSGSYFNEMTIDGCDADLRLACSLEISPSGIRIDFDGTSEASHLGINVPLTYTQAYASFGIRCVVGSKIPNNAGSLAPISATAPLGSILNAPHPAAVSARHAIGQMLPDVVLGALRHAMGPGSVPAEGASCLWNPVMMGGSGLTGEDRYRGEPFVVNPFHTGGTGARPGRDGLSATAFPSGVRSTPIEITEATAPLVFWRKEYLPDSGGRGEFRGGLGQVMEVAHADKEPFAVSKMFERVRNAARGRDGGGPGAKGRVWVPGVGDLEPKGREIVPRGARIIFETPGGGGLGDPSKRSPALIRRDERDGLVSK